MSKVDLFAAIRRNSHVCLSVRALARKYQVSRRTVRSAGYDWVRMGLRLCLIGDSGIGKSHLLIARAPKPPWPALTSPQATRRQDTTTAIPPTDSRPSVP